MAQQAARPDRKQKSGKVPAKKPSLLSKKPADTGRRQEAKPTFVQRVVGYLKNVRLELKKVIWPKRPEIISSTMIVIATLIVVALYIAALDGIFGFFINLITGAGISS